MKNSFFRSAVIPKKYLVPLFIRNLFVKVSLNRKINTILVISLVLLINVGFVSFVNAQNLQNVETTISLQLQTHVLRSQILTYLLDAETGTRGYVITGQDSYLEPYTASLKNYPSTIQLLLRLSTNPKTHAQITQVDHLANLKFAQLKSQITARHTKGFVASQSVVSSGSGKLYMDQIRAILSTVDAEKASIFATNITTAATEVTVMKYIAIISSVLELLIISTAIMSIGKELNKEIALADIVENAAEAIIGKSLQGIVTSWNKGAELMYGYTAQEMIGTSISRIVPKNYPDEVPVILEHVKKGDLLKQYETIRRKKDGSLITVSLSISPIRDSYGKITSVSIIAQDITNKKQAELKLRQDAESKQHLVEALETSNKDLEAFSYSVSHDLRAPLRAIDGFSKILEEDYATKLDDEGRHVLATIHASIKQMGTLIDDLLSFSRLGRQEVQAVDVDMTLLAKTVFDELKVVNPNRTFKFTCKALPIAHVDPSLIRQVWVNLLSNAIKFTKNQNVAIISIGSTISAKDIVYFVKDNGAGFDMKYVDKLFGVFQRLHSVADFEGTGIGLSIVKRIIIKHGGKVWAEGSIDNGATFSFMLPK